MLPIIVAINKMDKPGEVIDNNVELALWDSHQFLVLAHYKVKMQRHIDMHAWFSCFVYDRSNVEINHFAA